MKYQDPRFSRSKIMTTCQRFVFIIFKSKLVGQRSRSYILVCLKSSSHRVFTYKISKISDLGPIVQKLSIVNV